MPVIDPLVQSQFAERRGVKGHVLVWIVARHRSTGVETPIGFSDLGDHRDFVTDGETRTYFGAGNVIEVAPIRASVGLEVVYHQVVMPPFTDEMRQLLIQYDPRGAETRIYSVAFDIDTNEPIAAPKRFVKGRLQEAPTTLGAKRTSSSKTTLKIASNTRILTEGLPVRKSLDAHQQAYPGDLGREHTAVTADWPVTWGDE